jgi:hypothetical protein
LSIVAYVSFGCCWRRCIVESFLLTFPQDRISCSCDYTLCRSTKR